MPGRRRDGLTNIEHAEVARFRKRVRQLETRRDILSKTAVTFAQRDRFDSRQFFEFVTAPKPIRGSAWRVARLVRERDIRSASRRKGFKATVRDRDARIAPDLVDRNFTATVPNQLCVADITCVPTYPPTAPTAQRRAACIRMRTIAGRIGPLGITINNVAPGVLDTPIGASLNVDTEKMKALLAEMPIHRMGKPHQVAQLSVFLAADAAGYSAGSRT